MVAHAHELWPEAEIAYQWAEYFAPKDVRWPYYLGDVLSVGGIDLDGAVRAFERALELRAGYAPTNLRLGKVLVAANRLEEAAAQFREALKLEPELQPARLALAQIDLANGDLETAESGLRAVLAEEPRHGQALSTLGQVCMRQGRRDEAREIAARARGAAIYNLYSDPLMGQVVNEGISSVLLWERAKAFLDNGNSGEAAKGLEQVIALLPDNADVHQQLALAYHNLGLGRQAAQQLEVVIRLDPEQAEARLQFADLLLEQGQPTVAIGHLEKANELEPGNLDAGWLMGKARLLAGETTRALEVFEETRHRAQTSAQPIPLWVHNQWGSTLAQTGDFEGAGEQFRQALEEDPKNPQTLFYMGLSLEGLGQTFEAVQYYCQSMNIAANAPASGRLQALGHTCR